MFNQITLTRDKIDLHNGRQSYNLDAAETAAFLRGVDPTDLGVLPPAVRWLSSDFTRFLVERPPIRRSVLYHAADKYVARGRSDPPREMSIPWQVYFIDFSQSRMHIAFATAPMTSLDSPLYYAPLPNSSARGVCGHSGLFTATGAIGARLQHVITQFWTSGFNDNMTFSYLSHDESEAVRILPKQMAGVRSTRALVDAYEKATVPEVLAWDWVSRGTVGEFIDNVPWDGFYGERIDPWSVFCQRVWRMRGKGGK